jgi:hypothetical protein
MPRRSFLPTEKLTRFPLCMYDICEQEDRLFRCQLIGSHCVLVIRLSPTCLVKYHTMAASHKVVVFVASSGDL